MDSRDLVRDHGDRAFAFDLGLEPYMTGVNGEELISKDNPRINKQKGGTRMKAIQRKMANQVKIDFKYILRA